MIIITWDLLKKHIMHLEAECKRTEERYRSALERIANLDGQKYYVGIPGELPPAKAGGF